MWLAALYGGLASAMLIVGTVLAYAFKPSPRFTAIVMALGAGLLIGSVLFSMPFAVAPIQNAFEAMGTGEVDVNWAKQHHSLWLEEENRRIPGATPRATPPAACASRTS